jgi:hypothetical protein
MLGAAALAGCGQSEAPHRICSRSDLLVPRCGVLWGITPQPNTTPGLHAVEQLLGSRFDLVYRFHDLDDRLPTAEERALVGSGRILHVSIDSRIYEPPAHTVRWSAVAAGAYDEALTADARGIAALRRPVFVTFAHEPDKPTTAPGTPEEFVAAWRHVHSLFRRADAQNAVWVWVVTGYPDYFPAAARLWPGNRYVDWISWEAYNSSGCTLGADRTQYRSFADAALPFLRWLRATGPRVGIEVGKPMMISEAASTEYPGDPALTASWYQDLPLVLDRHPQIKAVGLWDRRGDHGCDYRFDRTPSVRGVISRISESGAVRGRP